jgi:hypothetical protein
MHCGCLKLVMTGWSLVAAAEQQEQAPAMPHTAPLLLSEAIDQLFFAV